MPYKMKRDPKRIVRIEDFFPVITWGQIDQLMLKSDVKKLNKWMRGQTCIEGGIYPGDLERFLKSRPIID